MSLASQQVMEVLRSTENMHWYVVPLLVFVIYIYIVEIEKKNWSAVYVGIAASAGEFIWEMFNSLVLFWTGFAPMWGTPGGNSAFIIYSGLNIEIALFFAAAGPMVVKALPEDRKARALGIPSRIFVPGFFTLLAVFVEILLNKSGLLTWDWSWWKWPNIWLILLVYFIFFYAVTWCHDNLKMETKKKLAILLPVAAIACHILLANVLGWV